MYSHAYSMSSHLDTMHRGTALCKNVLTLFGLNEDYIALSLFRSYRKLEIKDTELYEIYINYKI